MKERSAYFDNAKLILILLVVSGHMIEYLASDKPYLIYIYKFIYLFHIPAFTLLSGYFSKKISAAPKRILKFAICYAVFEVLYYYIIKGPYEFMVVPFWVLWYVFCLIIWNALLPLCAKSKWSVLIAIGLAVAAGYIDDIGYKYSLSRMFVFFPYFLIGYFLRENDFEKLRTTGVRIASAAVLAVMAVVAVKTNISSRWLYGSYSYAALGHPEWYAGVYRLTLYAVSGLACVCFLSLVPKKKFPFTYMGAYTLDVYLLHGFFVRGLADAKIYSHYRTILQALITAGFAVLLTFALLNVRRLFIPAKRAVIPDRQAVTK